MLGIDKKVARYVWTAAVVLLLLALLFLIRRTIFVFILALLLAYLLSPVVNLMDRFLPVRRTRTLALAMAYVLFVGLLILVGGQIGARVVDEAQGLAKRLPDMVSSWQQPSPTASDTLNSIKIQVLTKVRAEIAEKSSTIFAALGQVGLTFLSLAGELIHVVVIPILAFFFLKDGSAIRQHLLELVDAGPRRALLDDVMADIHILLAQYMRALVVLSLATFVVYGLFFGLMGVPYAILLAVVASLLEFIPMIGPLSAGVAIMLVALTSGSHALAVLIFMLAYRLFQDYVLTPHLMAQGVELHPLVVLFGVFAGTEVAGIAGTFLSVPVLALVRILYVRFRKARLSSQFTAEHTIPV